MGLHRGTRRFIMLQRYAVNAIQGGSGMIRTAALPALGMAMFWPFFRYASFVGALYPAGASVVLVNNPIKAQAAFLGALTILSACTLFKRQFVERLLERRRAVVAALMCSGGIGALLALGGSAGIVPDLMLWLSALLTATGFLASFLAWGSYFSHRFGPPQVAVLGVSLFASYVLLSRGSIAGMLTDGEIDTVVMPLATGLCWYFSLPLSNDGDKPNPAREQSSSVRRFLSPSVAAVMAFLIVGAVVRGVVDVQYRDGSALVGVSVALSALLMAACCSFCRRKATPPWGTAKTPCTSSAVETFALTGWIALSLLFLAGLFAFLALDRTQLGGDVVVVARTLMELVLWILLCDRASSQGLPPVPLFLCCGVLTEIASWSISYTLVPDVLDSAEAQADASHTLVLTAVFGVVALALAAFGAYLLSTRNKDDGTGAVAAEGALIVDPVASLDESVAERLVDQERLTPREARVAVLYAHGYSLGKVADELGITKSTAQSHIKNVYRKLSVHSRDELIERLGPVQ